VHWLDLPDSEPRRDGDAPAPSARRRAATRLGLGLGAAVAAGTLGVLGTQGPDVTATGTTPSAEAPPSEAAQEPAAHPSFGSTATVPPSSPVVPPPVAVAPEPGPEPDDPDGQAGRPLPDRRGARGDRQGAGGGVRRARRRPDPLASRLTHLCRPQLS
jgi:hypothetical protein